MLLKCEVVNNFTKAANTYNDEACLQIEVCHKLVKRLTQYVSAVDVAVDLGCGTGLSTKILTTAVDPSVLYSIDIAYLLLVGDGNAICADFEKYLFQRDSLDLVFSNMALQWALNFPSTLKILIDQIKSGGILCFSMPVGKTLFELNPVHRNSFYQFVEINNILSACACDVLDYYQDVYCYEFSSSLQALRSLKAVGANTLIKGRAHSGLSKINHYFKEDNHYHLTYEIGNFIIRKY